MRVLLINCCFSYSILYSLLFNVEALLPQRTKHSGSSPDVLIQIPLKDDFFLVISAT